MSSVRIRHPAFVSVKRIVPNLHAAEPAASRAFYEDVLGLELAMDLGWIVTFVAPGAATAQISVMSHDASAPVRPDVSIEVEDVDAVHALAERLGYEVVHPLTDESWGVRRFFVREPGGKVVNVLSHVTSAT
jgi:catechol 2,3-dioxygenase-like lactoylglutathione lyase family enzyme